jgi:glucose-1-phosphate adenylyltransferase
LDLSDPSQTLAVLLAGGAGTRLHELSALEAKPALPLAGRRLADFACAAASGAGLTRLHAVLGPRPDTLARHLREVWGDAFALSLHDAQPGGTVSSLSRCLDGEPAREILVLAADQVHALPLSDLLRAHREAGARATLATPTDEPGQHGPVVLDAAALRDAPADADGDLWADLLPVFAARGDLALWRPPQGIYWRDVDTLDDVRAVSLDFQGTPPCALPRAETAPRSPLEDEDGRALAFEVAGLRLSAPRFGARERGRWTMIEDSVVLPTARVAPGARLSRAVVAPGAIVPANLVVGEDPGEDARWFRVTPGGTTLITAAMLATRAAERMRAQFGGRLPGLVTPRAPG